MLHHVTLLVGDFDKSKEFYARIFKPLGYTILREKPHSACFGKADVDGQRDFWIRVGGTKQQVHSFSCIAFTAPSKQAVNDFHRIGLETGGSDNGELGYRKYRPNYYAAYILDPDGHNVEAVFDDPTSI